MTRLHFGPRRAHGEQQPSMLGALKLRLPFRHYGFEAPDFFQGAMLCVIPLSGATIMGDTLGIPFEVSVLMLAITNFLFLMHTSFGDPAVAGWITAGIPLYVAYLSGFPEGEARIQALIALQITLGCIFLFMGIFKGAQTLVKNAPKSLKAGIILGAGVGAIMGEFAPDGRVWNLPISILVAVGLSFFVMFSSTTEALRRKYSSFRFIAQYGIAFPFLFSYAMGQLIGEIPTPDIKWTMQLPFEELINSYSIFAVGFPPMEFFLSAIPLAISAYIIAFGDVLVLESLLKTVDNRRSDEKVSFHAGRNSLIISVRNFVQAIFSPHFALSGPLLSGGQALVLTRYVNNSRKEMDSYWGGSAWFQIGMSSALLVAPVVTFFQPGLDIGMTLNLLITGFVCSYIAFEMLKHGSNAQRGVAAVVATILLAQGAAMALIVGIALYFILEFEWLKAKEDHHSVQPVDQSHDS